MTVLKAMNKKRIQNFKMALRFTGWAQTRDKSRWYKSGKGVMIRIIKNSLSGYVRVQRTWGDSQYAKQSQLKIKTYSIKHATYLFCKRDDYEFTGHD